MRIFWKALGHFVLGALLVLALVLLYSLVDPFGYSPAGNKADARAARIRLYEATRDAGTDTHNEIK